jgi:hypothetical protein
MSLNGRQVLLYSLLTFLLLTSLSTATAGSGKLINLCDKIKPCQLLTKADAEKMLGQSARLTQETSELKGDVRQCLCAYAGLSTDATAGQNSVLFFSLEQREANPSAEQARQVLVSTKESNEHDTAILDLKGIGDEAILFSTDSSSHFIMARRGGIVMRLQIKRAAGTKSLEETKAFAIRVSKYL